MARKKKTDELKELDQSYQNIVKGSKPAKASKTPGLLIAIACVLLVTIILGSVWFLFSDNWFTMPDVTVSGIAMGGMSRKEAKDALRAHLLESYATENMTVTVLDTTLQLPANEANVQVDINKAVNAAYNESGEFDLTGYIRVDSAALNALLDTFGTKFNANLVETTATVEGNVPDLTTGEAQPGQTLVVTIGSPQMGLDVDQLKAQILKAYSMRTFTVTGECTVIEPKIPTAQELYDANLTPAVDSVLDTTTFVASNETYGYAPSLEQATKLLENAQYGDTLRIPFEKLTPAATKESLEGPLFRDVIGEYTTRYSGSDTNNRNTNLGLACDKINGIILMPGEVFSYNMTLGERTKENGWKPAGSYVNGLTVDTYGGGICQGSTTLYNCVLQADLKLVECWPHGYVSDYVPHGMDASVNWGTADFRFENTTNWPIRIEASRAGGKMTMRLIGTDEKDYYIKMTYKDISSRAYEEVFEMVDPDNNPNGYKDGQVLVTPYTGYRVKTYKHKYDKVTNELIETTLERDITYSHRDRKVVKFIVKDEPTEPTIGSETE